MRVDVSLAKLVRYPVRKNELLQAWDAADEYLIDFIEQHQVEGKRILILNDQFGALSSHLKNFDITVYCDSYVSTRSIQINTNNCIQPIHNLKDFSGLYDLVLMRAPKNLAFLNDQLAHLTSFLHSNSLVMVGFMVKYFTPGIYENLETFIGPIQPSLAKKKARIVSAQFTKTTQKSIFPTECLIDGFDYPFIHHSNLFSREKLDIGTRFLLEHMPTGEFFQVLDLGCANGILGIKAKILNPRSKIIFCDESAMAVSSARENFMRFFPDNIEDGSFIHTNCFEEGPQSDFDLVLCNPPFHQGTVVGDHVAIEMFHDAKRAMRKGGLLRVIGNSHLGYQHTLKRIFGNCSVVATNKKFMILDSRKS